ncbi:hypothetical protein BHM03_00049296 [Ensete ventricosum]|nr:hypothetical protein BHM03_00049296 [Ensete ventricosum]
MRTARYRAVPPKIDRRRSIEREIDRRRSIEEEKGKKKRKRKKKEEEKKEYLARVSSLPACRRHPRVAYAPSLLAAVAAFSPARGERSRRLPYRYRQYVGTPVWIAGVPNLDMVESIDDEKIMQYFVAKFGVDPSYCVQLVKHVKLGCPNLIFSGLMTIGMLDYTSTPENFKVMFFQATILLQLLSTFLLTVIFVREQTLSNCRTEVCKELGIPEVQCELSMGMSADFEQAVSSRILRAYGK